jgi:hypothetical protein
MGLWFLDKSGLLCKHAAMTTGSAATPDDPRSLLTATRELTRSVRRAQGGGWFALLVFGAATLLAIQFFRYGPHFRHCAVRSGVTSVCTVYPTLALWYWPVVLLLGYAVIGFFYLRRSRIRGVGTRVWPYICVGVFLGLLAAAWAVWALAHPAFLAESLRLGSSRSSNVIFRLTSPAGAMGLALLVLAWAERDWPLGAVTVVYLGVVGGGVNVGRAANPSPWAFLPHLLIVSGILMFGAGILALIRRVPLPPAP